jgi:hypothetical protein
MANKLNMELMGKAEVGLIMGQNPQAMALELAEEFDMAERTIWTYFRRIRERWQKEEVEQRPERRAHFRAMLMQNFRLSMATDNPMAGAATLRVLAKFDGHESPIEIKVSGALDIKAMSPMERRAEIQRLLAMRAEHLDGRQAGPALMPATIDVEGVEDGE